MCSKSRKHRNMFAIGGSPIHFFYMKNIKLIPKTRYGSNKISQHGKIWSIVEEKSGKFLLKSLDKTFTITKSFKDHDLRWVDILNDSNFDIEYIE